jgi:dihydroorotate dehydrogenase
VLYRALFWLILKRLPAESAHHLGFGLLRGLLAVPGAKALTGWLCRARDPVLVQTVFGRTVTSPLGLAAGFDKDARGPAALAALGFGAVELGTITAQAQPGNPKPRMFRLPRDRALLNRLGFNNRGAEVAALACAGGRRGSSCSASTSARPSSSTRPAPWPTTRARPSSWPAPPTTWW